MLKLLISSFFLLSLSATVVASAPYDERLIGGSDLFVMDDVSMSIITGTDADGASAITNFRNKEGVPSFRELTAAAIPGIESDEPAAIIAHRRSAAESSEYWLIPVSITNVDSRGYVLLQTAENVRTSGTGEEGNQKTHICTGFKGRPACVRVVNLSRSQDQNIPKWINLGPGMVSNLAYMDDNIIFAMVARPVDIQPKVVVGRSTVDVELVHWVLIDSNYGAIKAKINNIQMNNRTKNPWIGF